MELSESQKGLSKIVGKWETAFYISQAMLDDYSEQMSKLTKVSSEEIKKRIRDNANQALQAARKKRLEEEPPIS